MSRALLTIAFVLALASSSYAKNAKVFVFAAPHGSALFEVVPQPLMDSANDIANAVMWRASHVVVTIKRPEGDMIVQVTSREEIQGEYRVHVHVTTFDGHEADLTGASVHQWRDSASDIAGQLSSWAKADQAEIKHAIAPAKQNPKHEPS